MSNMFGAIDTSATGLTVYQRWMDAISDNVANVNTVRPANQPAFQAQYVVAQANAAGSDGIGNGVSVSGITYGDSTGVMVSDPTNPLADARGMVRRPNIDMSEQMTQLMMAERDYQANLAVIQRATAAYQAALTIGK